MRCSERDVQLTFGEYHSIADGEELPARCVRAEPVLTWERTAPYHSVLMVEQPDGPPKLAWMVINVPRTFVVLPYRAPQPGSTCTLYLFGHEKRLWVGTFGKCAPFDVERFAAKRALGSALATVQFRVESE